MTVTYNKLAEEYLHYYHGRNPLSWCYLTQSQLSGADKSITEIFHGWFMDGTAFDTNPAPGILAGGPNRDFAPTRYTGTAACPVYTVAPPQGEPPMKAYKNWNSGWVGEQPAGSGCGWSDDSWEVTENSTGYQSLYCFLAAAFAGSTGPTPTVTVSPTYAGSPTITPTITPTFTLTPVPPYLLIYDGDTAPHRLADGTVNHDADTTMTEVTGGTIGNAMLNTYPASVDYWAQSEWVPPSKVPIGSNTYLVFDIKENSGTVSALLARLLWYYDPVDIAGYVPGGIIDNTWRTARIPIVDMQANTFTTIDSIIFISNANVAYSVLIDNIRLEGAAATATNTPSNTPAASQTYTRTISSTPTGTYTPTISATATHTRTATGTSSATPVITFTDTPSWTATATRTMTMTGTFSPTQPLTSTWTHTPSWTGTPTFTLTLTDTGTPTSTGTITPTMTVTQTHSASPTVTDYAGTPTDTYTPTNSPTVTVSPTITITKTPCACSSYFGNTVVGLVASMDESPYFDSNKFTLAQDSVVHSLSAYVASTTGGNIRMALYANSGWAPHVPTSLLVESQEQPSVAGWNTVPIPEIFLAAGDYWIAWEVQPGTVMPYNLYSMSGIEAWKDIIYGPFPSNAPSANVDNYIFTVKADYCPVTCPLPQATATITPTYVPACACAGDLGIFTPGASLLSPVGFISSVFYPLSQDVAAQAISLYVASGNGTAQAAIYSNSLPGMTKGTPKDLIIESAPAAIAPGWNRIAVPEVLLTGNNIYWLTFQITGGVISYDAGPAGCMYYLGNPFGTFPADVSSGTAANYDFSVQLNYCPLTCPASPTNTPTATAVLSDTQTPIATETSTADLSPTQTSTQTTAVESPTVTITQTILPSSTNTPLPSSTNTPIPTATFTLTGTPTKTISLTNTPVITATNTPTQTPAAVPTSDNLVIDSIKPYPNPGSAGITDITVGFNISRDCKRIEFMMYTQSARLIRQYKSELGYPAGNRAVMISRSNFAGLASGTYYFCIEATDTTGKTAKSKIDKIILLK